MQVALGRPTSVECDFQIPIKPMGIGPSAAALLDNLMPGSKTRPIPTTSVRSHRLNPVEKSLLNLLSLVATATLPHLEARIQEKQQDYSDHTSQRV